MCKTNYTDKSEATTGCVTETPQIKMKPARLIIRETPLIKMKPAWDV